MRVIFMGTPDFAVGTLQALLQSEHEVAAVVTQPDKPKGRGGAVQYSPVKTMALQARIPVLQPKRVREPSVQRELAGYEPDVIVVVAFGQLIPKEILELAPYGCVNVHASLLPKYRGAAPIQWAVLNGEKITGVTTMRMDEGLDTGDILLKEEVELAADETAGSLFEKLSGVGASLLLRTLREMEEGTVTPIPQPAESPTAYASMLTKQMGEIQWMKGAGEIERLIRGLNPWPSAYTHLGGKTLKIWKAAVEPEKSDGQEKPGEKRMQGTDEALPENAAPGTVTRVDKKGFCVQTGDGILRILEVQSEGKKRMEAGAFLRGHALQPGEKLQ